MFFCGGFLVALRAVGLSPRLLMIFLPALAGIGIGPGDFKI